MSLAKSAGSADPYVQLHGGFYGGVVGQRLDQQGLSEVTPGQVGVIPWAVLEQFKPPCVPSWSSQPPVTGSAQQQHKQTWSPNWRGFATARGAVAVHSLTSWDSRGSATEGSSFSPTSNY